MINFFKRIKKRLDRIALNAQRQYYFNYIYQFIYAQGRASMSKGGSCKYRGEHGMKCAIGCIIPDSRYKPAYDSGLGEWPTAQVLKDAKLKIDRQFALDIQRAHDQHAHAENFRERYRYSMKLLAESYGLKFHFA